MLAMLTSGEIVLGRYRIETQLFIGGEAMVYKATDLSSNALVVVKQLAVLPGDRNYEPQVKRFQRCAGIRCNNPYIVDATDFGQEGSHVYLMMPFVAGCTLQTILERNGGRSLPPQEAIGLGIEMARALDALHSCGIVHRDIKPDNVMITPEGHVRIIDLTICRIPSQNTITGARAQLGSVSFMAPEQATDPRNADQRSDLYGLGTVLYLLLTGQRPIQGQDEAEIRWNLESTIPIEPHSLNSAVPEHASAVCMQLLEKDPDLRFQSALEVVDALQTDAAVPSPPPAQCPSCSVSVDPQASFCGSCGTMLTPTARMGPACLACGMSAGDGPTCRQCGTYYGNSAHRLSFTEQTYRIPEGIHVIGRQQLFPSDTCISRRQMALSCVNGTAYLQDAGSTNHTRVNGRIADRIVQLNPGDEVTIAGHVATYSNTF